MEAMNFICFIPSIRFVGQYPTEGDIERFNFLKPEVPAFLDSQVEPEEMEDSDSYKLYLKKMVSYFELDYSVNT